jgi:hypothetical protein
VGRGDRHAPRLGQPARRLAHRPGASAARRVGVELRFQRERIGLGQARWAPTPWAVVQPGDPLGQEALDELAHRLGVVADGARRLRHGRPVGDGGDHAQPLMDLVRGRAGAQPAVEAGALGRRQGDAERGLHGGVSFRPS